MTAWNRMGRLLDNLTTRMSLVCEDGQTFVEYALLVVFVALVAVAGASLVGSKISSVFTSVAGLI